MSQPERVCTCLDRADGIGAMHGHHDDQCPLSEPAKRPCRECGEDHFTVMAKALTQIFDTTASNASEQLQKIKAIAYKAIPKTECQHVHVLDSPERVPEPVPERHEWHSMESAPKDGTPVLVVYRDGAILKSKWEDVDWNERTNRTAWAWVGCGASHSEHDAQPIGWLPLDALPPPKGVVTMESDPLLRVPQSTDAASVHEFEESPLAGYLADKIAKKCDDVSFKYARKAGETKNEDAARYRDLKAAAEECSAAIREFAPAIITAELANVGTRVDADDEEK